MEKNEIGALQANVSHDRVEVGHAGAERNVSLGELLAAGPNSSHARQLREDVQPPDSATRAQPFVTRPGTQEMAGGKARIVREAGL